MRLHAFAVSFLLLPATAVLPAAAAACGGQATIHAASASPFGTSVSVLVTYANVGNGCGTPTWVSYEATCSAPAGWVIVWCGQLRPTFLGDDTPALTSHRATGVHGAFQCVTGAFLACPLPAAGAGTTDRLEAQATYFSFGWACSHSTYWEGSTTHCELH